MYKINIDDKETEILNGWLTSGSVMGLKYHKWHNNIPTTCNYCKQKYEGFVCPYCGAPKEN